MWNNTSTKGLSHHFSKIDNFRQEKFEVRQRRKTKKLFLSNDVIKNKVDAIILIMQIKLTFW